METMADPFALYRLLLQVLALLLGSGFAAVCVRYLMRMEHWHGRVDARLGSIEGRMDRIGENAASCRSEVWHAIGAIREAQHGSQESLGALEARVNERGKAATG